MSNIYLSNVQCTPLLITPRKPFYNMSLFPQPNVFSGSPQHQVKLLTQVIGRSNSPNSPNNKYIRLSTQETMYGSETKRGQLQCGRDFRMGSQHNNQAQSQVNDIKSEQYKKIVISLTNYYDEIKELLNSAADQKVVTQQDILCFIREKIEECRRNSETLREREQYIKSIEQEVDKITPQIKYENNLGLVSQKVDIILDENLKLRHQLNLLKEDKQEEFDYFQDKQAKFIQEYHDMIQIRKKLDNEVINASKENHQRIIEIKNQEIDNLVTHIESLRIHFNDNQTFIKDQSEYQLKRLKSLLSDQENIGMDDTSYELMVLHIPTLNIKQLRKDTRKLKQELKTEREVNKRMERIIKDFQDHHEKSTRDFEINSEQFELVDKSKQESGVKYLRQEIMNVQNENETLSKDIHNLHQLLNQRNVEFQFIQKQMQNEKDELLRVNKHIQDQVRFYQRDQVDSKQKQVIETQANEINELYEEIEQLSNDKLNLQFQIDQLMQKRRLHSHLELDHQDPQFLNEEINHLKLKNYDLENQIRKYEDQKDNIVRLVHEVINEQRGCNSQSTELFQRISDSFSKNN